MTEFTDYATVPEAAAVLGIHPESARRLIRKGDLPSETVLGRVVVPRDELREFADGYSPRHKSPAAQHKHGRRVALRHAIEGLRGEL